MSRLRYVKGNVVEITGGNYKIYSEDNIEIHSGDKIIQSGEEKGVSFGKPKSPPAPEIVGKCVVQFRPYKDWEGEYGFDWIRTGDTGYKGDVWYNTIIGKNRNAAGNIDQSTNYAKNIVPDNKEYNKIVNTFQKLVIKKELTTFYAVPKMSLMKGKTAKLILKTKILEEPKKLQFKYNAKYFQIGGFTNDNIESKQKGNKTLDLSIKCLDYFAIDQNIDILADDKICGRLTVLKNHITFQANVVFVPVETNLKVIGVGKVNPGEMVRMQNIMNQMYIISNVEQSNKLNLTGILTGTWFKMQYSKFNPVSKKNEIEIKNDFHSYLDNKFFANPKNAKYKTYFRVYVFGENAGGLNGIAEGIGKGADSALVFPGRITSDPSLSSATHEVLHTMGVYHTFDNDSKFTFIQDRIDNIMDYSHWSGIKRISTSQFQWNIIQSRLAGTKKINK